MVYASSVTEHTPYSYTNLVVNYLVELTNPNSNQSALPDPIEDVNQAHYYGNNCQLAMTAGIQLNDEVILCPNQPSIAGREVPAEFIIPSEGTSPLQVSEISSSSDTLERLVSDILGDDGEIGNYLDLNYYDEYSDFMAGLLENDSSHYLD